MKSFLSLFFAIALVTLTGTAQAQNVGGSVKGQREANLVSSTVVINEIYGAGGCNSAGCSSINRDYIELKNISLGLANIGGWSVQYASATGTTWTVITIPAGTTLRPGDTFLIGGSTNGVNGTGAATLPTPNVSSTLAMSGTAGKIALVSNNTALSGTGCPISAPIVDYVGYGATANCSETAPSLSPSATTSIGRTTTIDTDSNSADFTTIVPSPQPAQQPTASNVTIGGRVLTSDGRGIAKSVVTLIDNTGNVRTYLTNGFGYYSFDALRTGETYIISVRNKHYQFNPDTRVISLENNVSDSDFTAEP